MLTQAYSSCRRDRAGMTGWAGVWEGEERVGAPETRQKEGKKEGGREGGKGEHRPAN